MQDFNSSLLREKFVIRDAKAADETGTVALSNRFAVELRGGGNRSDASFVVRGHNMHSVLRMAARVIGDYHKPGSLAGQAGYDWAGAWEAIVSDYEYAHNPQRWIAVYLAGACVFAAGQRHPFLDLIEKCAAAQAFSYDHAIPAAEKLFGKTGRTLRVEYDANVALAVNFTAEEGRLGIILRGPEKTTTFSIAVRPQRAGEALNIPQCLGGAAAFLEGVELAFLVGMNMEKIRIGTIKRFTREERQTREGRERLERLAVEIASLEQVFTVCYRPEKPDFTLLLAEAEELGQRILATAARL